MRVCEWDWMKCLAVNLTPPPSEPEIRWMVKVESPFFTEMQSAGFFFRTRSDETDLCPSLSLVRSRNGHSSWSLQPFKGLDIIVLHHTSFFCSVLPSFWIFWPRCDDWSWLFHSLQTSPNQISHKRFLQLNIICTIGLYLFTILASYLTLKEFKFTLPK